jgi:hypothetical protein
MVADRRTNAADFASSARLSPPASPTFRCAHPLSALTTLMNKPKLGTLLKEHSAIDVKNSFLNNELKPNLMDFIERRFIKCRTGHH